MYSFVRPSRNDRPVRRGREVVIWVNRLSAKVWPAGLICGDPISSNRTLYIYLPKHCHGVVKAARRKFSAMINANSHRIRWKYRCGGRPKKEAKQRGGAMLLLRVGMYRSVRRFDLLCIIVAAIVSESPAPQTLQ